MIKGAILYDWPIKMLQHLTDSDAAQTFADTLDPVSLDSFVDITDRLRSLCNELKRLRQQCVAYAEWVELKTQVKEFTRKFPTYPHINTGRLTLFFSLAAKAAADGLTPDTTEIDVQTFKLYETTVAPLNKWFSWLNKRNLSDSLVIFSVAAADEVEKELATAIIAPDLIFHALALLGSDDPIPSTIAVMIQRTPQPLTDAEVSAYAKLVLVAHGHCVHVTQQYNNPPAVAAIDQITVGTPYQQLSEVFEVLSEYNGRQDVLTKYLTLYHVVENFMFRRPIVELESKLSGRMFSIRDFRRLFRQVEENEASALRKFLENALRQEATAGTSCRDLVVSKWATLTSKLGRTAIDKLLVELGVSQGDQAQYMLQTQTSKDLADLVYIVRNAIVHNKATEWHLTYSVLDGPTFALIHDFLIPTLEQICFALISRANNVIWYTNRNLALYS